MNNEKKIAIIKEKISNGFNEFIILDKNPKNKRPLWIVALSGKEKGEKFRIINIEKKDDKVIYEIDDTSFMEIGDKVEFILDQIPTNSVLSCFNEVVETVFLSLNFLTQFFINS